MSGTHIFGGVSMLTQCRPKLYFVKLDVQACFDTIEQTKLLGILRDLISEVWVIDSRSIYYSTHLLSKTSYIVQRRGQVTTTGGKIKRSYVKSAVPDGKFHSLACSSLPTPE